MILKILILLVSLLAYGSYGLPGLGCLMAATAVSYLAGRLYQKAPWLTWLSITVTGLSLVLLKLEPYTSWGLLAPMGVSYFTLRLISYNADVARGKIQPEKNIFRFALYAVYLPYMFIGPIESYDPGRFDNARLSWEGIFQGAARILWGGFKKLVIAARIGVIISTITGDTETYRGLYALAAMLLYSVQLYSDFSGGIDMVLGTSRMLGITLSENFDVPYFSQSFQEFWRRWHMTLGTWLRNYVYIPLGGNRKGKVRKYVNTVITFLVSGYWHGAHYLLWGALNGIFVCFGEKLKTRWKTLNRVGVFLAVSFLWAFFIWPDTLTALRMAGSVFTAFDAAAFFSGVAALGLTLGDWIVLGAAAMVLWICDIHRKRLGGWYARLHPAAQTALMGTMALVILVFGMYGIGFNAEAFIYSRF